jgi:hypothetical protein
MRFSEAYKRKFFVTLAGTLVALGSATVANAASVSIPFSYSYVSFSSPTDPTHPDFYTYSMTFNLPAGYTNASLNITEMTFDDRGVVQLNGTTVTSSGITNGLGLVGQMVFTAGGTPVPFTFDYGYLEATTFAPITTGFQTGLNTIELIVNDTSGGLNFRDGLLSGGYYWYGYAPNIYQGGINPATSVQFQATVTYDLDDNVGQTPLPGALPLFATGLAGLGLIAHRRKRKPAA